MVGVELVLPEGQREHGGQPVDPTADVAQGVEGRLVGPVDVLEHQHRGAQRVVELAQQRVEHRPGVGSTDGLRQLALPSRGRRRGAVRASGW
jgi:hypothetical protein